jgi:hypothetical protein
MRYRATKGARGTVRRLLVLFASLALLPMVLVSTRADAQGVAFLQWPDGEATKTFGADDSITIDTGGITFTRGCAFGINDFFHPFANIYIVPSGSVQSGGVLSNAAHPFGAPSVVEGVGQGNVFVDETIGFTAPTGNVGEGDYAVVFDECQDGHFDSAIDTVVDPAFNVVFDTSVPSIAGSAAIAAVKARARAEQQTWNDYYGTANQAFLAIDAIKLLAQITDAAGKYADTDYNGTPISTLYGIFIKLGAKIAGIPSFFGPLSSFKQGALLEVKNRVAHYQSLADDPPDPNYAVPVKVTTTPSVASPGADPLHAGFASVATSGATEGALVDSVRIAIERYEGAAAAKDAAWAEIHARAIQSLSLVLRQQLSATRGALNQIATDFLQDQRAYDDAATQLRNVFSRVASTGFVPVEQAAAAGLGLSQTQLDSLRAEMARRQVVPSKAQLLSSISDLRALHLSFALDLTDLSNTAAEQVAALKSRPEAADNPAAKAGGPYSGAAGTAISFDASSSSAPTGSTYEWDFDGDGYFNEGSGAVVQHTYGDSYVGVVGVKVTTANDRSDIGYAFANAAAIVPRPTLTATPEPATELVVPLNSAKTFTATASPGTHATWTLDGNEVGSGPTLTYEGKSTGVHLLQAITGEARAPGGAASLEWILSVVPRVSPPTEPTPISNVAFTSTWDSSTSLLPQNSCPRWTEIDTSPDADGTILGGKLVVGPTTQDQHNVGYIQQGAQFSVPDTFVVEGRLQYRTGTSQVITRTPASLVFGTSPFVGNALNIGKDEVFLQRSNEVKEASVSVDTDDTLHTYRVEIAKSSGRIDVFYDGQFITSGFTFTDTSFNGTTARVAFGELSLLAKGSSDYLWVRHNGVLPRTDCDAHNTAPVADDQETTALEDTPSFVDLGESVSDEESSDANLSYEIVRLPSHGTLSGSTGGRLSYAPAADFNGPDSFTFRVTDRGSPDNCSPASAACASALMSETKTVDLFIEEVNDSPLPLPDQVTTEEGHPVVFDPRENDRRGPNNEADQTLTIHEVSDASHGVAGIVAAGQPNAGQVKYTPSANFNGDDSFSYTVCDNGTTSGTHDPLCVESTVTMHVAPNNDTPTLTSSQVGTRVQFSDPITPIRILAADADSPISGLTPTTGWQPVGGVDAVIGLPDGLSLTEVTAANGFRAWRLGGAPQVRAGSYDIRVIVTDGTDGSYLDIRLVVEPEDAAIEYIGDTVVNTTASASINASAIVREEADGTLGTQLSATQIRFSIHAPSDSSYTSPVSSCVAAVVVTALGAGKAQCALTAPAGTYVVRSALVANPYYVAPVDNAAVTVSVTDVGATTGGGWIPGTVGGARSNFGYTARSQKDGAVIGNSLHISRHVVLANAVPLPGGGFLPPGDYEFVAKSVNISGLAVSCPIPGSSDCRATFAASSTLRATNQDTRTEYDVAQVVTQRVDVTDGGEPGSRPGGGPDAYAIRVYHPVTGTIFQLGTPQSQIPLQGGNIQVRP